MNISTLLQKAMRFENLTVEEGTFLFKNAALSQLMLIANELRKIQVPYNKLTYALPIASFVIFTAFPDTKKPT